MYFSKSTYHKHFTVLWVMFFALFCSWFNLFADAVVKPDPPYPVVKWDKLNDKSSSVLERFGGIYSVIHSQEQHLYDSIRISGNLEWEYLLEIDTTDSGTGIVDTLRSDMVVFGWHPYWMGEAFQQYRFDLLSHVSWFSYDINALTGLPNNPDVVEQWKNSGMIEQAHAANCKALLTLTSHHSVDNKLFLANEYDQQEKLIEQLLVILEENNADGIDINFEQIPRGQSVNFTNFIEKLSTGLKAANKDYILSLVLPKVNWHKIYNIAALSANSNIDFFIVTGYDYHTGSSATDGPIAPLRSTKKRFSIVQSIYNYIQQGLSRDKIVLGLPHYGGLWQSKESEMYSEERTFEQHLAYRQVMARYNPTGDVSPNYDLTTTFSAYYLRPDTESGLYEKCWFDDSLTLSYKHDWILEEELKGTAIWALGYDNSRPELWNLISEKYTTSKPAIRYAAKDFDHVLARYIYNYRYVIGLAGIFYLQFVLLGLVIAFMDWRVRDTFFANKTLRSLYIFSLIPLVLSILVAGMYIFYGKIPAPNSAISLILGLIIGVIGTVGIVKLFDNYRKKLPT